MNNANKLIFKRSEFRNEDEFYDALYRQIRLLIETNNVFSFHENPNTKGVYVLQFNPCYSGNADLTFPVWLNGDEIIYISAFARKNEYESAKKVVDEYEIDDDFWSNLDNNGEKGGNDSDA